MTDPSVRRRRWALVWLASVLVLGMATWLSASAVISPLSIEWSLGPSTAAWLTIAVQFGFVAGALISALLNIADILPARTVIAVSAVGAAAANAMLIVADGPGAGIPLRALTGAFMAGIYPPALKVLATWFTRGRGVALGILVGGLSAGTGMPHLVNGLGGLPWRQVIGATSVLTLGAALIALTLVREGPYPFPRAVFDPRQAGRTFGNRGVRLASIGYFGHMWELYAMWAWYSVYFADSLDAAGSPSPRTAALVTFAVIAMGAPGSWVGGVLGDRWGRSKSSTLMLATSGACCVLAGAVFGRAPVLVAALGLVWGFAVIADSAQFSTVVTEVADRSYVGTALTLQLAVGFTLTVATIWLVPIVRDAAGWGWAMAMLAAGPAMGIVAMQRLRRAPEAAMIAGGRG